MYSEFLGIQIFDWKRWSERLTSFQYGRATFPAIHPSDVKKDLQSTWAWKTVTEDTWSYKESKLQDYILELFIINFKLNFPQVNHIMEETMSYKQRDKNYLCQFKDKTALNVIIWIIQVQDGPLFFQNWK